MKRNVRRFAVFAGAACVVLAAVLAGAIYALQTNWFKNKVREKIVDQVEQASGGRVELGSFNYDWRSLTADFQNFVVHGKEPGSALPLVQADRVRVRLRIVSLLERSIDVDAVIITRPRMHLVMEADGSTNIPTPRSGPVSLTAGMQALLNLKVRHFEVDRGSIEAGLRRIPLSLRGENTYLLLAYNKRGGRYEATFSSHDLRVDVNSLRPFSGTVEGKAQLERDVCSIQSAVFKSGESAVRVSGTFRHFADPVADFRIGADLDASDITAITKVDDIGRGKFTLHGDAHYDENSSFAFRGKLAGRDVSYRIKSFDFKRVSFESDVVARPRNLEMTHLVLRCLGGMFSGAVALKQNRDLQVDGTLSGLRTSAMAELFSKPNLPWSGIASGPLHLQAVIGDRHDLIATANLSIVPGTGGIPLAGNLDATYRAKGGVLELRRSNLGLPGTRFSFSGRWDENLDFTLDSSNMEELNSVVQFLRPRQKPLDFPKLSRNGSAHFDGAASGRFDNPQLAGNLTLSEFEMHKLPFNNLRSHVIANENEVEFSSLVLEQEFLHATAKGRIVLSRWTVSGNSALELQCEFRGADLVKLGNSLFAVKLQSVRGVASGTVDLHGTVMDPRGVGRLEIANVDAYGERLNQVKFDAMFEGDKVQIDRGHMQAGPAELSFSGSYQHNPSSWREGQVELKIDSNGFPVASLVPAREYLPGLNANFEIHGQGTAHITADRIEPTRVDGTAALRSITVDKVPYGSININGGTRAQSLTTSFSGDLRGTRLTGSAQIQMAKGYATKGAVNLDRIQLSTIAALIHPQQDKLPFEGVLEGGFTFEGQLQQRNKMHGTVGIERLELGSNLLDGMTTSADLTLRNVSPVIFQYADGLATISRFQMRGQGSDITVSGSVPFLQQKALQLKVNGAVDLRVFQLFDPNVRSAGESLVTASIGGTLTNPAVTGTLAVKNGTFFANDLPNGLTAVNGTVRFDHDRATIEKLTAQTGGGELSMTGFMSFSNGGPLIYRLEASAENVRVRYGGSVSVTATSQLRLTGTSQSSILSGTATVSRVIFNPNTDVGNLLASAATPTASPSNEKDFLTGLQFDIHVESAPNLQVSTELSRDVEAEIDLRLRGTRERPILLGSITANQGDIRVFGTKYTINRGDINFINAVKIEPVLDLDLQTQARGITVDITISGAPGKLNINYRSDPPLQPRDIIALLTVGRAPNVASNVPNVSVTNDVSALQSGANTVLGQAISPASNRLSKLFGITNIKIDPLVQGITNAPQARLTVEQQISRQITVTYVTNLSQTSEQIFRLEWAFSRQYSLVALRDDNGEFGVDIQYRKRFK